MFKKSKILPVKGLKWSVMLKYHYSGPPKFKGTPNFQFNFDIIIEF